MIKKLRDSLLKMSSDAPRLRAYPYEIEITPSYAFAISEERNEYRSQHTEGYIAAGIPAGTWVSDGAMKWLSKQEITAKINTSYADVISDPTSIYGFVVIGKDAYAYRWTNNGLVILNDVPLTHAHVVLAAIAQVHYADLCDAVENFGDLYAECEQGGDE